MKDLNRPWRVKDNAYERPHCIVCGALLEHEPTGRPRKFCSAACKQKDYRELRKWAKAAVNAVMAGEPEPEPFTWRWSHSVTKLSGSAPRSESK
jgi:endogenous inhibitor of DNA gyrase (YacG/DUF329 family)